jgi:hypothetical protein
MCSDDENRILPDERERCHCYERSHPTSVTSQTLLENTNLDLQTWFLAAYLVFTTKKGLSSYELARNLDVKLASSMSNRRPPGTSNNVWR